MKVKQEILDQIDSKARMRIATTLGTTDNNIYWVMRRNAPNGRLTKMDFLKAIEKELGIPVTEILQEDLAEKGVIEASKI